MNSAGAGTTFRWPDISRHELFAGLMIVGVSNGVSEKVALEFTQRGAGIAIFNTFGISVVVWVAAIAGITLLLEDRAIKAGTLDILAAAVAALAFLAPESSVSWLAISGLAIYLLGTSSRSSSANRAASILLAMTFPMYWGRLVMGLMSEVILGADAVLVSWIVGTERSGNVVPFADGSGSMWIEPGCSSLTNLSLALLCAVLVVKGTGHHWTRTTLTSTALACISVVTINVVRISLVGFYPQHYELIHGDPGAVAAGWLTTVVVLAICLYGIKRDAPVAA